MPDQLLSVRVLSGDRKNERLLEYVRGRRREERRRKEREEEGEEGRGEEGECEGGKRQGK